MRCTVRVCRERYKYMSVLFRSFCFQGGTWYLIVLSFYLLNLFSGSDHSTKAQKSALKH